MIKHGHARHGGKRSRAYEAWCHMKRRCYSKSDKRYARYGGRGIAFCPQWRNFAQFCADMGPRPEGGMLERKDNNGNYEPGNCKWATGQEQNSNKRNCIYVEYGGERITLKEACRRADLRYRQVHKRITEYGWPITLALSLPIGQPWGAGRAARV